MKVHGDSIKLESFSNTLKFVVNSVSPFSAYLLADLEVFGLAGTPDLISGCQTNPLIYS